MSCKSSTSGLKFRDLFASLGSFAILFLFMASITFAACPDGMVSYWTFDEGSGTIAADSVDANNGTLVNGPVWTTGIVGNALQFDGVDDYVRAPLVTDKTSNVTIEMWVNVFSRPSEFGTFVKVGGDGYNNGYAIGVGSDGTLKGLYEWVRWIPTGRTIGTGWHHVALIIDSAGIPNFYLDGQFVGSYPGSGPKTPYGFIGIGGYGTRYFNGLIDEVAIYNRSLSADEIQAHYMNGIYYNRSYCSASPVDSDGDLVPDEFDNCPSVYNPSQSDLDSNGVGDACQETVLISNCSKLDAPTTYVLTNDLNVSSTSTACFNITVNGVTLDCSNHLLTGGSRAAGQGGYGIFGSNVSNVTIKNCAIQGFLSGIRFEKSTNILITNNSLNDNTGGDWWLAGISFEKVNSSKITNNTVVKQGSTKYGIFYQAPVGVYLSNSYNNEISNNLVANNTYGGLGIVLTSSSQNQLVNNRIEGVTRRSLVLSAAPNNLFRNNALFGVSGIGLGGWEEGCTLPTSNKSDYVQDMDESNTIDGKPIKYFDGVNVACPDGQILDYGSTYSEMIFVGCHNITLRNTNLPEGLYVLFGDGFVIDNVTAGTPAEPPVAVGLTLGYTNNSKITNSYCKGLSTSINVCNSSNNEFNNVTVPRAWFGTYFGGSDNNTVRNCKWSSSHGDQLVVNNGNNNLFENNVFGPSGAYHSLQLISGQGNVFRNNTFTNNRNNIGIGIGSAAQYNSFTGNNITGNKIGLAIGGSANNIFKENNIFNNVQNGIYLDKLGASQWTPVSRTWVVENGEYSGSGGSGALSLAGNSSWTNYAMEAKIGFVDSPYTGGVAFRVQDPNNFYLVWLSSGEPAGQQVALYKQVNKGWARLAAGSFSVVPGNYTVKVIVNGNNAEVYIDGALKINYTGLNEFSQGKIGVRTDSHTHFDNVRVASLDGTILFADSDFDSNIQIVNNNIYSNGIPQLYTVETNFNMSGNFWGSDLQAPPSLIFDGMDDYLKINEVSNFNLSQITVAAWIKWGGGPRTWTEVIRKDGSFYMAICESPNYCNQTDFNVVVGNLWKSAKVNYAISANEWHHLVGTFDNSSGVKLYIDGQLVASNTSVYSYSPNPNTNLYIGSLFGTGQFFNGLIDEITIYNRSLSPSEVGALYNKSADAPIDFIARWQFNEQSGQIAYDDSQNHNDGILGSSTALDTNDPRWSQPLFIAGVDSNRADVVDSHPYGKMNGWEIQDADNDGIPDNADNCPTIANADQADFDQDGLGNVCDPDADGDGILNEIDKNRITAQDLSLVPSNDFNDLTTFGYIAERGTWNVSVVDLPAPNGVRVSISGNGTGKVRVISCNNNVETTLDQDGETADITCGSTTVLAGSANPFIEVRKPDSSVKGKAVKVRLQTGNKVTLGSPVYAFDTNTHAIETQIVDENDSLYAYLMLEPGQTVDITPEDPTTGEPVIMNLAQVPITVYLVAYGINATIQPGETFTDAAPPVTTASYEGIQGLNGWFTSDVLISLSATDDASGVKQTYICVDRDNTCAPLTGTSASLTEEGVWYVRYYSTDNSGKTEAIHSDIVKIDKTAPSVSIEPLPTYDADGIYVVSWNASDNIATTFTFNVYRDGQLYATTNNNSITEVITTDGESHQYFVEAVDWAGLKSTSSTVSTTVDLSGPSTPIPYPLPVFTTVPYVQLKWNASEDILSGVKSYSIYKNSDLLTSVLFYILSYTDNIVQEGSTYEYQISAMDWVGHESALSEKISTTIDTQPPTTSYSVSGTEGLNGWYTSEVGVTLSASDSTSGVAKILYRIDNGEWMLYSGTFSIGEGTHTIDYYSVDNAGNNEWTNTIRIKVDKTAPVSQDNIPSGWLNSDFKVQISASDNLSGVSSIYACTGQECEPTSGQSSFWLGEGIHYVNYYAVDNAGNKEGMHTSVARIDKTAPVTTPLETGIKEDAPFSNVYKDKVVVAFTATDSLSKVDSIYYCVDTANTCQPNIVAYKCDSLNGDCPGTASSFVEVSNKGTSYVRFFSEDRAGNKEEIQSINVTVDKDSDNDTVYDNFDACPTTAGIASWQGCNYADLTKVKMDIIDQTESGVCVDKKGKVTEHCRLNIEGAAVKIYDRNDPAFQAAYGKNPKGTEYARIFESSIGWIGKDVPLYQAQGASCFTNSSGRCIAGENAAGEYLVLVKFVDPTSGQTVYVGKNKDQDDFKRVLVDDYEDDDQPYERTTARLATKSINVIKHIDKKGNVKFQPGKKLVVLGSELDVITPDYTIWEGNEYVYPFVFSSEDEWTVDVCMYVPDGYKIAEGYNCTQTFVANESKVVAFTIQEISSPEPDMNVELKAQHKGVVKTISVQIPGQRVKGFEWMLVLPVILLAIIAAAVVYVLKKKQ